MNTKRLSKWLILIIVVDILLGLGIGHAVELYQRQFSCPETSSCIIFGASKSVARVSIPYIVAMNLLWVFFRFRNKLITAIYIFITAIYIYCILLLSNMYLVLTPSYLEVHDVGNIYPLTKFSQKVNYDDIIAFQYKWSGSTGRKSQSPCQKNILIELEGGFLNLSPYGTGSGQHAMSIILENKNIRINKSVGYLDGGRDCYDRYER